MSSCNLQDHWDLLRRWLHFPTENGKPRIVCLNHEDGSQIQVIYFFVELIKKVNKIHDKTTLAHTEVSILRETMKKGKEKLLYFQSSVQTTFYYLFLPSFS